MIYKLCTWVLEKPMIDQVHFTLDPNGLRDHTNLNG